MGRTLLIVDDHPGFRRLARKLFEAAGFRVVGDVGDGASAIAAVEALNPDVVLLDVLLPDTTGFDVVERLAGLDATHPVVVLTSSRTAGELAERIDASTARGFITKSELTAAALTALVGEAA